MTLAAYLHRLDPFAIGPFGGFGIRWYGLSYLLGFFAAWWIMWMLAKRRRSPLTPQQAGDFIVAIAFGTIIGGRLGYCVFYQPELLWEFTSSFPFWGFLAINKGGMASHGGIIGIIVACIYFARRTKLPALHLVDLTALTGPVGLFFGRLANFVNGELFGRPCSPALPWAVKFPQEISDWYNPLDPNHDKLATAEFESVLEMVGQPPKASPADQINAVIDAVRTNDAVAATIEPLLTPRHPSQIYEALLEGLFLLAVLWWIWRKPRKPGVIAAWSLIVYAVVRIFGEQFRMPDSHIGFEALGLTRGQWLSILMLIAGVVCAVLWSRRPAAPLGGWRTPALK